MALVSLAQQTRHMNWRGSGVPPLVRTYPALMMTSSNQEQCGPRPSSGAMRPTLKNTDHAEAGRLLLTFMMPILIF